MSISIKEQILFRIRQHKQGWAFSAIDLISDFNRREIDESLSTLTRDGDIRRVMRGVYDLPLYSSTLGRYVAPDINQITQALARKFNWNIYPDGNTALNYLGLSTQIVSQYIYLSTGPSKTYTICEITIKFKHISLKEIGLKSTNAILVTQAIKALGEARIFKEVIRSLAEKFSLKEWGEILKHSINVPIWIYEVIKNAHQIAKETRHGQNS